MSSIKSQTLKGFRDFLPQEARKRQYVINILKNVFESYGFEPLETPALEYEEILLGKYGEEGDKLMYRFEDRGKRKVAMRYDQTVPLARVVAQYGDKLAMPFKRYQIQNVWRAENPQKGRYREFLQCDADIIGSNSPLSDAEVITVATKSLERLGFKNFKILINDRNVFEDVGKMLRSKFPNLLGKQLNLFLTIATAVDKIKKIYEKGVITELVKKGLSQEEAKACVNIVANQKPTSRLQTILDLSKEFTLRTVIPAKAGIQKSTRFPIKSGMTKMRNMSRELNPKLNIAFSPALARGLDYYTGMIFEIEIEGYSAGSVCGGGRYDNLIGLFSGKPIPAVGFAFGFDRLIEAMDELKLFPKDVLSTKTKVLVTIFNPELLEKSIQTTLLLYRNKVAAELYLDEHASLEKQLKYADKKGIPYAVIVGPDETKKKMITLRNMKTRKQKTVSYKKLLESLS